MKTTVTISGLQELNANLHRLRDEVQKKITRASVASGAKIIREQAVTNSLPSVRTGRLRDAIGARRMTKTSHEGFEQWAVGVFKGRTLKQYANNLSNRRSGRASFVPGKTLSFETQGPAYYWKFVEFGTVKMAAKPFLRPAFAAKQAEAANKIMEELRERIEKAAKA